MWFLASWGVASHALVEADDLEAVERWAELHPHAILELVPHEGPIRVDADLLARMKRERVQQAAARARKEQVRARERERRISDLREIARRTFPPSREPRLREPELVEPSKPPEPAPPETPEPAQPEAPEPSDPVQLAKAKRRKAHRDLTDARRRHALHLQ